MKNENNIFKLLTPSWVSSVIGVTVGLVLTAGTIVLNHYESSGLRLEVLAVRGQQNTAQVGGSYHDIANNVTSNSFVNSLPLLLTWAAVGLIIYFFAISLAGSFGKAVTLKDQLGYVNTTRQQLLREALRKLMILVAAVIGWFVLIKLSLAVIVPYILALASAASYQLTVGSALYVLLAVLIGFITVQLHAVLLRLIVLRPRVFVR